ncbi:1651_t:CDS:2 [Entrophospora sp. SA101]|nr:1651_t:CDS:2 [Entrophospora sp. SA101]
MEIHYLKTSNSMITESIAQYLTEEIHAGARLHLNDDSEFKNHHLKLKCAIHHVNTNSATCGKKEWILNVKVHVSMFGKVNIIINTQSAPYCDSFLGLDQSKNNNPNEVQQAKRWKLKSLSLNDYQNERNKPARDKDFLFFLQLPKLQFRTSDGLWDRGWAQRKEYFRPFAGRAYVYAIVGPFNINTATYTELMTIDDIGVPEKVLERLKFLEVTD